MKKIFKKAFSKNINHEFATFMEKVKGLQSANGSKLRIDGPYLRHHNYDVSGKVNAIISEGKEFDLYSILHEHLSLGDEIKIKVYYDFENPVQEYCIGDEVVFSTTATGTYIVAIGKIIEKDLDKNYDQYKVEILDSRDCSLDNGNKRSVWTDWRWVDKANKLIPLDTVDYADHDLAVGDYVVTNMENRLVITDVKSIKKTVRTTAGNVLNRHNYYKIKR